MKNKVEGEAQCDILNEPDFEALTKNCEELEEMLHTEKARTEELERQITLKSEEL